MRILVRIFDDIFTCAHNSAQLRKYINHACRRKNARNNAQKMKIEYDCAS
jgi:hypothetical protein